MQAAADDAIFLPADRDRTALQRPVFLLRTFLTQEQLLAPRPSRTPYHLRVVQRITQGTVESVVARDVAAVTET